MKTLDEILEREDYKRLTSEMAERVYDIAIKIRRKMHSLDIKELSVDGLKIRDCKRLSNVDSYVFLAVVDNEDYEDSLYDINDSGYLHNDYSCYINGATNKDALAFLNRARKIIEYLGEKEEEKVKAIQQAMADTADL